MTAAQTVIKAVRDVAYGPTRTFRNLTLVPLVTGVEREADYVVLDEALARGWIEITELTEAGRVPELQVINSGDAAVLLLDGEELLGAKQNRVLNLTILVPPRQTKTIPVSCVEAGRWRRMSASFASSPRTQFAEGRAAKMRHVSASLSVSGQRVSNQQAVWSLIASKASRLEADSDTSAMAAMYEKAALSLEEFVTAFAPVERQVGAVFIVNASVAGLELFDAASTWRKLSAKLVRSYALDAIDRVREPTNGGSSPKDLIDGVISSEASVFTAVGEGEDVRLAGGDVCGAALVARGRAIHVSAFPGGS